MAVTVMEMMMKLGLQNDAMAGLQAVETILKNMHNYLRTLQGGLDAVGRSAIAVGTATASLGVIAGVGLNALASRSAAATEEFNKLKLMVGETDAQLLRGAAWKVVSAVPGSEYLGNIKMARELVGVLGSENIGQITQLLPDLVRAQEWLTKLNAGGPGDIVALTRTLGRTGITDPAKQAQFLEFLDHMTRAVQVTGGQVTAQDYMKVMNFGGVATMGWSKEFIDNVLPKLMLDFKASGGGMVAMQGNIGMLMSQEFRSALQGARQDAKGKGIWHDLLPGVNLTDTMINNPFLAAQTIGPRLMAQAGGNRARLLEMLSQLFTNPRAASLMAYMIEHADRIGGYAANAARMPGNTQKGMEAYEAGSPAAQLANFTAALENFSTVIGEPLERIKLAATGPMIDLLNSLSGWVTSTDPKTMDIIAAGMWTTAAAMVGIGTAAVIAGALLLAPGGAVIVALTALAGFLTYVGAMDDIKAQGGLERWLKSTSIMDAIQRWLDSTTIMDSLVAFFNRLRDAIEGFIRSLPGKIPFLGGGGVEAPSFKDRWDSLPKTPTVFNPSNSKQVLQPVQISLNLDGRTLAQAISDILEDISRHPTSSAVPDSSARFASADGGYMMGMG